MVKRPTFPEPRPGIDHKAPIGPKQQNPNQHSQPIGPKQLNPNQYPNPIGPVKKGRGERAKDAVVGFLGRGLNNFKENAARSTTKDPGSDVGWLAQGMRNFRENNAMPEPGKKGRKHRGGGGPVLPFDNLNVNQGFNINPAFMNQGGLDLSMHPDPMYQHASRKKSSSSRGGEGRRKVVVTRRTYYEDDRD